VEGGWVAGEGVAGEGAGGTEEERRKINARTRAETVLLHQKR
jgi:hypothetical protein